MVNDKILGMKPMETFAACMLRHAKEDLRKARKKYREARIFWEATDGQNSEDQGARSGGRDS